MFQKIRKEGFSKVLAVTKILPLDWQSVNLTIVKQTKNSVTIKFEKVT